jgi:hypothetical protein
VAATDFSSRDEIAIDGFPIMGEPEAIAGQKSRCRKSSCSETTLPPQIAPKSSTGHRPKADFSLEWISSGLPVNMEEPNNSFVPGSHFNEKPTIRPSGYRTDEKRIQA